MSLLEAATKANTICSLENLINCSLILYAGGGWRLFHYLFSQPRRGENGLLSKRPSRSQSHVNGGIKFLHPLSVSGTSFGIKLQHTKRLPFFGWSYTRPWCGKASAEVDKSSPYCGQQSMETVECKFFSYPLVQQVWRYATNIIWQLFAERENLDPRKSFSMMEFLFDQPLCKTLQRYSRIKFLTRSNLP